MEKLQKVLAELTALLKRAEAIKAQAKRLDEQIEQKKLELQKSLSKTEQA